MLLARAPPGLALAPNPDEVADVKWVTQAGLEAMLDPASGLAWSPWFRIIATKWLPGWWADLEAALAGGKHVDAGRVHRVM